LKKMPPMPVTRFIESPRSGGGEEEFLRTNDGVAQRAGTPSANEADLSQSSIPLGPPEIILPRSLEPIVRLIKFFGS
jgi:hypothetical protein